MRAGLTVKQRKFVAEYARLGNGTEAALAAYDTADRNTARAIAAENLAKPAVQRAVGELLDAGGLSDAKLAEIHTSYLVLADADDPQLKALGLKALDMAYKLKGSYAPERHRIEAARAIDPQALEHLTTVLREMNEVEKLPPSAGR
jgi:hypothetical protein